METTWLTVLVRAWVDGDGLKIRMHASPESAANMVTVVETTPEDAGRRLVAWLAALAANPAGLPLDPDPHRRWPGDDPSTPGDTTPV
jgi:hypothetical protein